MALATPSSRELFAAKVSEDDSETSSKLEPRDEDAPSVSSSVLEPGDYLDRYRILEVVGTGGIGVVYAAADEALGRKVAIKLLRPSARSSSKFERRRARLIREAQALARLSHPNVVPVYEVGMFEDRVFLAMEFVEGLTMRRWLRRSQRRWDEILDKYIQAGRGLAAAHAADIVHRDFKPENVLVGHDGRVRVLDFGLATPVPDPIATGRYPTIEEQQLALERTGRVRTDEPRRPRPPTGAHPLTESAASLITAHGKVMGTPAYMSPEQSRGELIDARADQYSFCVAVWEALYGERPHGPLSATSRSRLNRRVPERALEVPPSILRALERGLSLDPADRFADMDSLLAALERRPTQWRRWVLVGALPLSAALAVLVGVIAPTMAEPCPRDPTALDGIWDAQVRTLARQQMTATGRPYATATWNAVEEKLDLWTERWLDTRVEACEATKVRHEQSPVLLDVRMACLDRQANALRSVTDSLTSDPLTDDVDTRLEAALGAVLDLPDPSRCGRAELAKATLSDAELTEPLEQLRLSLARARGLLDVGKYEAALTSIDEVFAQLSAIGADASDPGVAQLVAEASLVRGRALAADGHDDDSERELESAVFNAQTAGSDEITVNACAALVDLLAGAGRFDDADIWAALGRATLARLGGDASLEAELLQATAKLARERGQLDEALADQRRVLVLVEQSPEANPLEVARILGELVLTEQRLGRFDEAEQDINRAITILTREFGFTHPERGVALGRQAALEHARGRSREALSIYFDALAIFELAYGTRHVQLANTLHEIAAVHESLGEHGDALLALQRAHELEVELRGAEHPDNAMTELALAGVLLELGREDEALEHLASAERLLSPDPLARVAVHRERAGLRVTQLRYDEALEDYEAARAILTEHGDPDDPLLGLTLGELARLEHLRGDTETALEHQRSALAKREAALGSDDPGLALHLTWVGVGLVALERYDEARTPLERAIAALERDEGRDTELLGEARLALAQVVWSVDDASIRGPRARELARAAITEFEQVHGRAGLAKLDAAKIWLRQHGG